MRDRTSGAADSCFGSTDIPDRDHIGLCRVKIHTPIVGKQHSTNKAKFVSAVAGPGNRFSLADQYLDTMIMDDVWRAACLRAIRHSQQQKRRALKRLALSSIEQRQCNSITDSYNQSMLPSKTRFKDKSKIPPSTPITSPSCPDDSDNSCVSYPTISNSPTARVHSTRSHPIDDSTTLTIDVLTSTPRRHCVSCKRTSTTCWRHALGGSLCNSCGLR